MADSRILEGERLSPYRVVDLTACTSPPVSRARHLTTTTEKEILFAVASDNAGGETHPILSSSASSIRSSLSDSQALNTYRDRECVSKTKARRSAESCRSDETAAERQGRRRAGVASVPIEGRSRVERPDSPAAGDELPRDTGSIPLIVGGTPPALVSNPGAEGSPYDIMTLTSDEDEVGEIYYVESDDDVAVIGSSGVTGANNRRCEIVDISGAGEDVSESCTGGTEVAQSGEATEAPSFQSGGERLARATHPLRPRRDPRRQVGQEAVGGYPEFEAAAAAEDSQRWLARNGQSGSRRSRARLSGGRGRESVFVSGADWLQAPNVFHQLKEADRRVAQTRAAVQRLQRAENELFRERRQLNQRCNPCSVRPMYSPFESRAAAVAQWERRLTSVRRRCAAARRSAAEAAWTARRLRRRIQDGERQPLNQNASGRAAVRRVGSAEVPAPTQGRSHEGPPSLSTGAGCILPGVPAEGDSGRSLIRHCGSHEDALVDWEWVGRFDFASVSAPPTHTSSEGLPQELISRLPCILYAERKASSGLFQKYTESNSANTENPSAEAENSHQRDEADVKDGASQDQFCAICMEAYDKGAVLRYLPCLHAYHQACIDMWLSAQGRCPVCKESVLCLMERGAAVVASAPAET
ncbi:hypothetical protein BESB_012210 [Besnoitia besnoiti]|uniref:RING-type E3 ubiquitin transferase n=1 Tax=Besnoitia besnoiti TaxID=94643 RepID=A0A2A9M3T8_BESBE|nr:hypothetical protein BESB_012210 [Besnoitia besnoiti]PFH32609.1 hypothetical protein BESB_012210 [Besnoitia besnoiti]